MTSVTNSARKIDKIMENGRSELRLPGVSIAIMRDHRLMFAKGYGLADRAANTRATAHTIYAIGSLSKQFTAAAIMKLNEENRLQIDQPITKYLPKYPASQTSVPKIRNLLQQNSGLPAWDDLPEFQDVDTANSDRFELSKIIDVIARQPLLFSPGEWWSYSNSNYTVLAGIVEQVTGTQHDEYLVDAFLNRLDLRSIGGVCVIACVFSRSTRSRVPRQPLIRATTGNGG